MLCCVSCDFMISITQNSKKPEIICQNNLEVFSNEGGSQELVFSSKQAWTADVDQDWFSIDMKEGEGGEHHLTVSVEKNTSGDERNGSLTISSLDLKKSITVTQKQNDALTLTSEKVEMGCEGGDFPIIIKSNIPYEVEIDKAAESWIIPVRTKAIVESSLSFTVAPNESVLKREGKIRIKSSLGEEVVTVYQNGEKPEFILTETEMSFDSRKHSFKIELKSNTTFTMSPVQADWIHAAESPKSMSSYTKTFTMDANRTEDTRQAVVEFEYLKDPERNGKERVQVKVTQRGMDVPSITVVNQPETYASDGGSQVIEIRSPYEWAAASDQAWCHVTPENGEGYYSEDENAEEKKQVITITADENASYDERTARVTIQSRGKKEFLTITQKQKDALIVTSSRVEIGAEGGAFHIEVKANIPFEYEVDKGAAEWISEVKTKALETSTLYFSVKQNTTIYKREASIVINSALKKETVKIYQAGEKVEFILSKSEMTVEGEAHRFAVEIKTNTKFRIYPLYESWIRPVESPSPLSMSTYTKYFEVDENTYRTNRQITIQFAFEDAEGRSHDEYMKIIQKPSNIYNSLVVTHSRMDFRVPTILGITGKEFTGSINWGEAPDSPDAGYSQPLTHKYEWYTTYRTYYDLKNGDKVIFDDIDGIEIIDVSRF